MTFRERLAATLGHRQPDRVCLTFRERGGFVFTNIHNI